MRDIEFVDQNLRVALRFFGEATPTGEIAQLSGAQAVYSGLDYGVFNIAMLASPVTQARGGLEDRIAECARYYKPHAERWSFWLCEDLLDSSTRRRAKQVFAECGMRVISQPPGMLAPSLRPAQRLLPEIECLPVADQQTRDAFAAITSVCFDIPYAVSQKVYQGERGWAGKYKGYVAFSEGTPVSIVALVNAGGVLGIYSLATYPGHRRRGFGEALLRAAVASESARNGPSPLILQATEIGHGLYRRLGFRDVGSFAVFLTK